MSSPIYRHDLDPTGLSPDNRVLREPVALANYPVRVFVPSFGAFFGDSMVITDTGTGAILLKSQYYLSQPAHIPTLKYGKGIYYCVVITDASVSANLSIDYQDLGGEWAYSNSALATQLQVVLGDARAVDYSAIINKPDRFSPGPHLHDAGDVFGMEYLIEALYAIRDSISLDGTASMIAIYDQTMSALNASAVSVQTVRTELYQSINGLLNQIAALQALSSRVTALESNSGGGNAATYVTASQLADALAAYAITHPTTASADKPGEVRYFAFATVPDCWRVADGAILGRVDYPELFAAIGTTFNHDESLLGDLTRFQLPDLRGEFIRGLDLGRGIDAGRVLGSAQTDDFKSHTHPLNLPAYSGGATPNLDANGGSGQNYTSGATGGIETRPRNVALLPCICYTSTGVAIVPAAPTYAISTTATILYSGLTAVYSVQTTFVPNGTTLFWTINSITLDGNNFTDNAMSGTVTIVNNTGIISRTLDSVLLYGDSDVFTVELRTNSITGPVVAASSSVRTMPSQFELAYHIAPNITSVNEGESVTFNITTTGVMDGTTLAYLIAGSVVGADFVDGMLEGTYVINNNTGSFIKEISADSRTEGIKTFNASVTLNVGSGTTLWTSESVTISDTSTSPVTPTYAITVDRTSLNALDQAVFTVTRTNGTDGAGTLYYIDVSCADVSCVILGGALPHVYSTTLSKIDGVNPTISLTNTGYSEQNNSGNDQTALINLRDGGHTGPILASSPLISLTIDIQN